MEYNVCAPYKYKGRHNEDLSEYSVTFNENLNDFGKLREFVEYADEEVPDKRVNIYYASGFDPKKHKELMELHGNLHVRIRKADEMRSIGVMKKLGAKFYLEPTAVSINNLSMLNDVFVLGASSVYIADDLAHMLDDVSVACYNHDVQLRCVLNKIPSDSPYKGVDPASVIYRPEDIDELAQYFDVFELDCYKRKEGNDGPGEDREYDWYKFDALYRAYFKDKKWNGDLREIIDGLKMPMYSSLMPYRFFFNKFNCYGKCVLDTCDRCMCYMEVMSKVSDIVRSDEKESV